MKYKLLIVEDDLFLQEAVSDYFRRKNWEVTCVANGKEAIEITENTNFHMILLDVMIPKLDGFLVCRKIRQSNDVPIIFITARVSEEDKLNVFYHQRNIKW